jgi:hypothetical protein
MPIGAPGWPELAAMVASTYFEYSVSIISGQWRRESRTASDKQLLKVENQMRGTYSQHTDGVDGFPVLIGVSHDCD